MFEYVPRGPFELDNQNQYFGGWPTLRDDPKTLVMSFAVEGWKGSAAVTLRQEGAGKIRGKVYGPSEISGQARVQALAVLSLDIAAEEWPEVGKRDAVIGELQQKYGLLRPILFHSPYEAAAGFIIGHRISIQQKQAIMRRMAEEMGERIIVDGQESKTFPLPQVLLTLRSYKSLHEKRSSDCTVSQMPRWRAGLTGASYDPCQ